MRVVGVEEFGGPEELRVFEVPSPEPGPGQVRIRVHAAAVNPTDTLFRAGAQAGNIRKPTPPFIPGMDAAGVGGEGAQGCRIPGCVHLAHERAHGADHP